MMFAAIESITVSDAPALLSEVRSLLSENDSRSPDAFVIEIVDVLFMFLIVIPVPFVHKYMQERTREKDEVWQCDQDVRCVFSE